MGNSGNGRITQQKCGNDSKLVWKKELKGNKFLIINKNGKTLDNGGNRNRNGNPIYSWTKHGGRNQLWSLNKQSNGKYLIKESSFNKCLDDTGRKNINGVYHLWSCSSHNKNQWFEFKTVTLVSTPKPLMTTSNNNSWFNIVGPTGLCVAANSGNGRITQQKCGNDSKVVWKKELKGNKFLIINKNGKTLDNGGNRNRNGN